MNEKVYDSYLKKCKELGIKPTPKEEIFAEDILRERNEKHVDIALLSQARKQKTPLLSQTAKEALTAPIKRKPKQKIATVKPKKEKPVKQKRILLSDEEKKANARKYSRLYYENNKEKLKALKEEKYGKNAKPPKVKLTDEEKRERARERSRLHYLANRTQNAKPKIVKPPKEPRVLLSDEEKKALKKEKARLYHLARKDDPVYQARRKANSAEWNKNNKDKIAVANKKYRDEVRTPEQLEEKRRKAREYRQKNLEHMREKDRARQDQRREYLNNNPEAKARKQESERKRYAESMKDAVKAEKLREKWRNDSKRAKTKNRSAA